MSTGVKIFLSLLGLAIVAGLLFFFLRPQKQTETQTKTTSTSSSLLSGLNLSDIVGIFGKKSSASSDPSSPDYDKFLDPNYSPFG